MKTSASSKQGFTLVELMVSMAIGMGVLVIAVGLLSSTGDGYERVGGGVGAEREARALLGQLTADLSTAQYHKDMLMTAGSESWPLDRIGFLTLQPQDAQLTANHIGDLCAVRYYIKDEMVSGKTVRVLMRGVSESYQTFQNLKNGTVDKLFQEPASDGGSGGSDTDEAIAYGVVSFEVRPKVREKDGSLTDWTSRASSTDTTNTSAPDVAVIRLVVARRELAGKLNNPSDWSGKGPIAATQMGRSADATLNKNFQVYETTIRFGYHDPK